MTTELSPVVRGLLDTAGWALVHSLWQGALVAAGYACFCAAASRAGANVRYAGGALALVLLLVLPVATACLSAQTPEGLFAREAPAPEGAWADSTGAGAGAPPAGKEPAARPQNETSAAAVSHASNLRGWAEQRLAGLLPWLILIPAGALLGLTPRQLEAVLAHELAHVRRYDYAVNLLQTAAETLLFYHPAAWWLSRRVRAEREHACDDAAVEATGDVLLYARALAALEHLRAEHAPPAALALAANGGSLMQRIQRLVNTERRARGAARRPAAFAAALTALVLVCGALAAQRSRAIALADPATDAKASAPAAAAPRRQVAVTFVTYPGNIYDAGRLANKSRKLLRALAAERIQAVAFVNDARLYHDDGSVNEARVQALREWLDAGHELGNETAHHTDLYKSSVEEFQAEVIGGEQTIAKLSAERGRKLRYFSYPYLNTGSNPEARAQVEAFLRGRGYQVHPVTIDTADWVFGNAYIQALRREDDAAAEAIRAEYVPYMERMFEFYEQYSREVVGREFPQVLMLTAGALNFDSFADLAAMMKRRGYTFVTMEQATRDEAYGLPDTYTGRRGDSWVRRWAVSKGMPDRDIEEEELPESMRRHLAELQKSWKPKGNDKK
ncbi:MAG: polysaccharide deacetylase family protein [Acidobacteria bacterium]|nr:polysaccharide deacetylase family protein [Acidobacteriota bacterium]